MDRRLGRQPVAFASALRLAQAVIPWSMLEIFLLGVLVAAVKLAEQATIVAGPAAWALGGAWVALLGIAYRTHVGEHARPSLILFALLGLLAAWGLTTWQVGDLQHMIYRPLTNQVQVAEVPRPGRHHLAERRLRQDLHRANGRARERRGWHRQSAAGRG